MEESVRVHIRFLLHCLGLSSLGAALILQYLVLSNILAYGYFRAMEHNSFILYGELVLTLFAFAYLTYLLQHFFKIAVKKL